MSNLPSYNVSNEHLLLINILNGMYVDNLRQINNLNDSIYSLNESNRQIRNLIIQMLYNNNGNSSNTGNTSSRRNNFRQNQRNNTFRENSSSQTSRQNSGLGRIYLNNTPYIIDSFEEYRLPTNNNNENSNTNFSRILQSFFQPVEVFPTQSQIESATRHVRYCDIITPRNVSCPISLTNFTDNDMVTVIRFCGHIFNTEELNTWFRTNSRCPVCRYDIRNYNSNASSEIFGNNSTAEPQPSTPSIPLNETENTSSQRNEERSIPSNSTTRPNNLNNRTNTTSLINSFFENIINDYNLIDLVNPDILNDVSGNYINNTSDSEVLINLLTNINNRR
jgi:hypothetical protein